MRKACVIMMSQTFLPYIAPVAKMCVCVCVRGSFVSLAGVTFIRNEFFSFVYSLICRKEWLLQLIQSYIICLFCFKSSCTILLDNIMYGRGTISF